MPLDPDKANANLANLLSNNWIDSQTRRLRVTLEMWNLQLDQVIVMFWDSEFSTGGHIREFFSASVVRVHYYDKPSDRLRLGLEIVCILFWFYYLYISPPSKYMAFFCVLNASLKQVSGVGTSIQSLQVRSCDMSLPRIPAGNHRNFN